MEMTEVSHEMEIMEGGSGKKLMGTAQQSTGVGPLDSDMKNPREEESVSVGSGKSVMDEEVMIREETLQLLHAEKPMAAAKHPLLFGHEKISESKNSAGVLRENELGKCLEMMRISRERQLDAEIQRALLDIQEKLAKRKNRRTDEETLQLLKDMSNKLDVLEDQGDEKDTTMAESSDIKLPSATTIQDDRDSEMAYEAEKFASHRRLWEYKHGKTCGLFTEPTVLSSMQFTNYTHNPYDCSTLETLQIFSIKLTRIDGGLEFPFSVYGVVAVRDIVDRKRNLLFYRHIGEAQELKQNDPFLHLIGPSRAIMFAEKVCIEIELKVKGAAGSQDKALISCAHVYRGGYSPAVSTICFKNILCTLELSSQPVKRTVQATILGVQVAKHSGSWPLKYGGLVACVPLSGKLVVTDVGITRNIDPSASQIVLVDSKDEAVPKDRSGYIHLWRQVVSVEFEGGLDIVIQAYSKSGATTAETRVHFIPKVSNISQKKCALGDAQVTITVAWSLVSTDLC